MVTLERKLFYAYQRARKELNANDGLGNAIVFAHAQEDITVFVEIRRNQKYATSVRNPNKTS